MIKLTFAGDTWAEVVDQVRAFADDTGAAVAGVHVTPAEPEAPAARTQPAEASENAPASDEQPGGAEESEVTEQMVVEALRAHVKRKGRDSAVAILKGFGAERASQVAEAERAAALEKLTNG